MPSNAIHGLLVISVSLTQYRRYVVVKSAASSALWEGATAIRDLDIP